MFRPRYAHGVAEVTLRPVCSSAHAGCTASGPMRRSPTLRPPPPRLQTTRHFSATLRRCQLLDISSLPDRITPTYQEAPASSLLSLHWPRPPRNVLLIPKLHAPHVLVSTIAFARHLHSNYPDLNLCFEDQVASQIHEGLPFPVYTNTVGDASTRFPGKVDVATTLGGDGTILRAASLFSLQASVPPILSFSMGSLGFLGEWKFDEYKRAWREVYMSGSGVAVRDLVAPHTQVAGGRLGAVEDDAAPGVNGWEFARGKSMGPARASKVLLRHRLRVGVYDKQGRNMNAQLMPTSTAEPHQGPAPAGLSAAAEAAAPLAFHAINELLIHRGPHPHLAIIDIYLNNHFLTEAVADGILVSTPTGSTAYSLSAGGSIIHPLVGSLLITPICPRSLSFRPLVLPLNTKVVLRLSEKNRGRELDVSIDGKRRTGAQIGMEVRVEGEMVGRAGDTQWKGGVPCIIRTPRKGDGEGIAEDDDGWVGGLNGLLKFNYPFGDAI